MQVARDSNANLPNKRIRELEARAPDGVRNGYPDSVQVRDLRGDRTGHPTGRVIRVGGMWSMASRMYVAGIPDDWKPSRFFEAGPNQYQVLLDTTPWATTSASRTACIIQDILIHGGRRERQVERAGALRRDGNGHVPGLVGMILGPRKRHGDRIMAMIRKVLDPSMWTYDRRDASLRLANTSSVVARNAQNYIPGSATACGGWSSTRPRY